MSTATLESPMTDEAAVAAMQAIKEPIPDPAAVVPVAPAPAFDPAMLARGAKVGLTEDQIKAFGPSAATALEAIESRIGDTLLQMFTPAPAAAPSQSPQTAYTPTPSTPATPAPVTAQPPPASNAPVPPQSELPKSVAALLESQLDPKDYDEATIGFHNRFRDAIGDLNKHYAAKLDEFQQQFAVVAPVLQRLVTTIVGEKFNRDIEVTTGTDGSLKEFFGSGHNLTQDQLTRRQNLYNMVTQIAGQRGNAPGLDHWTLMDISARALYRKSLAQTPPADDKPRDAQGRFTAAPAAPAAPQFTHVARPTAIGPGGPPAIESPVSDSQLQQQRDDVVAQKMRQLRGQ